MMISIQRLAISLLLAASWTAAQVDTESAPEETFLPTDATLPTILPTGTSVTAPGSLPTCVCIPSISSSSGVLPTDVLPTDVLPTDTDLLPTGTDEVSILPIETDVRRRMALEMKKRQVVPTTTSSVTGSVSIPTVSSPSTTATNTCVCPGGPSTTSGSSTTPVTSPTRTNPVPTVSTPTGQPTTSLPGNAASLPSKEWAGIVAGALGVLGLVL